MRRMRRDLEFLTKKRENQLRVFYSTTGEINALFTKQQEQLMSMQKALEGEENYDNASLEVFLNTEAEENVGGNAATGMEVAGYRNNTAAKAGPSTSPKNFELGGAAQTSSEECSATEKHDCNMRSQDDENTQEAEFPNDEAMVKGGFGSDIDGVGTAPIYEGDADGTERVLETEIPGVDGKRKTELNKIDNLEGDTMQLEDDTNVQETEPQIPLRCEDSLHHSQSSHKEEVVLATFVSYELFISLLIYIN